MANNGLGKTGQLLTGLAVLLAGKNTFGYTDEGTKPPEFEFEKDPQNVKIAIAIVTVMVMFMEMYMEHALVKIVNVVK